MSTEGPARAGQQRLRSFCAHSEAVRDLGHRELVGVLPGQRLGVAPWQPIHGQMDLSSDFLTQQTPLRIEAIEGGLGGFGGGLHVLAQRLFTVPALAAAMSTDLEAADRTDPGQERRLAAEQMQLLQRAANSGLGHLLRQVGLPIEAGQRKPVHRLEVELEELLERLLFASAHPADQGPLAIVLDAVRPRHQPLLPVLASSLFCRLEPSENLRAFRAELMIAPTSTQTPSPRARSEIFRRTAKDYGPDDL